jgi:hypothetical protein
MPRGADTKREHEYDEMVDEFHEEHRYEGREEEVAARIVNKQRAEHGETKEAKKKDKQGRSPDKDLPIDEYDRLTVDQAAGKLSGLSHDDLENIRHYETKHQNRKTMLEQIERRLRE